MENWRVKQTTVRKNLTEVKIQRRIFQEDVLLPLLFVTAMIPPNHILRKCTGGCKLNKFQEKINHLTYMDIIKPFAKNGKTTDWKRIWTSSITVWQKMEKNCCPPGKNLRIRPDTKRPYTDTTWTEGDSRRIVQERRVTSIRDNGDASIQWLEE